jgi:type II secretory pathway pseudopilin PulG
MVEIAICLAVIGIALVSIIGVLPIGMHTQRDNREETIINQDATVLMEAIRGGARGLDDLTNYVYAITNHWTNLTTKTGGVVGYTNSPSFLVNGANIVGLLSTPEYTDAGSGAPIPSLLFGGVSNHIVAYVRSISGPAVEKPPQDNALIRGDSFSYQILCVNAPAVVDTNTFLLAPLWQPQPYNAGNEVLFNWYYWQAVAACSSLDVPGQTTKWTMVRNYNLELVKALHELRLTFFWPQQPNGKLGPGRQTFRTMVAGQVVPTVTNTQWLYFYQPQSFINVTNTP